MSYSKQAGLAAIVMMSAILVAGCATTGGASDGSYDSDYISAEELQAMDVGSLYEIVRRLRPRWLDVRATRSFGGGGATRVVVYRGQTLLGGTNVMTSMAPGVAPYGLKYLDAAEAYGSRGGLGSSQIAGAIVILTEPPEND